MQRKMIKNKQQKPFIQLTFLDAFTPPGWAVRSRSFLPRQHVCDVDFTADNDLGNLQGMDVDFIIPSTILIGNSSGRKANFEKHSILM
jgi:hypothetical protein